MGSLGCSLRSLAQRPLTALPTPLLAAARLGVLGPSGLVPGAPGAQARRCAARRRPTRVSNICNRWGLEVRARIVQIKLGPNSEELIPIKKMDV